MRVEQRLPLRTERNCSAVCRAIDETGDARVFQNRQPRTGSAPRVENLRITAWTMRYPLQQLQGERVDRFGHGCWHAASSTWGFITLIGAAACVRLYLV